MGYCGPVLCGNKSWFVLEVFHQKTKEYILEMDPKWLGSAGFKSSSAFL